MDKPLIGRPPLPWNERWTLDPETGCWNWTQALNEWGYGRIRVGGKKKCAHRYSWEMVNGKIPDGLFCCHHCDNPACVNPEHLFLGTPQDNVDDMIRKGRQVVLRGEANKNHKLSVVQVLEIRKRTDTGTETFKDVAKDYGVTDVLVRLIHKRKSWKSLPDEPVDFQKSQAPRAMVGRNVLGRFGRVPINQGGL